MNAAVLLPIIFLNRIHYNLRLLSGGSIIKIDDWLAVYLLGKYREILSDLCYIECGYSRHNTTIQFRHSSWSSYYTSIILRAISYSQE